MFFSYFILHILLSNIDVYDDKLVPISFQNYKIYTRWSDSYLLLLSFYSFINSAAGIMLFKYTLLLMIYVEISSLKEQHLLTIKDNNDNVLFVMDTTKFILIALSIIHYLLFLQDYILLIIFSLLTIFEKEICQKLENFLHEKNMFKKLDDTLEYLNQKFNITFFNFP